jgi:hypothetical protein
VNFQLEGGVYIVSHVVDDGYLQIGKKKMEFHRELPPTADSVDQQE